MTSNDSLLFLYFEKHHKNETFLCHIIHMKNEISSHTKIGEASFYGDDALNILKACNGSTFQIL